MASTRPVHICGEDYVVAFARPALDDMATQVAEGCIWINSEHMDFLPPPGRLRRAEIREAEDGEAELYVFGEELPQFLTRSTFDFLDQFPHLPTSGAPSLSVELEYVRGNFDEAAAASIEEEGRGLARPVERWAVLPPLEFFLVVSVVWGAKRFLGSFLDQLGAEAGMSLASKIGSWARKSRQPNRVTVFVLDFRYPDDARLSGFVFAAPSEIESTVEEALQSVEELATIAGMQKDHGLLPGMKQAAFFFHCGHWKLGWWTDGERVVRTEWFEANPPDVQGILSEPPE